MDLYELLSEPVGFDIAGDLPAWAARAETQIRADERAKIVSEIAQIARDNASAGRPTRAAWFTQLAERVKKGPTT